MQTADSYPTSPLTSKMQLAPIIERFMDLQRQRNAVLSKYDLIEQDTPFSTDQYDYFFDCLGIDFRLLRDPRLSGGTKSWMKFIADDQAELSAMEEMMRERRVKLGKMYNKRT